jgi:hypothetical protein
LEIQSSSVLVPFGSFSGTAPRYQAHVAEAIPYRSLDRKLMV